MQKTAIFPPPWSDAPARARQPRRARDLASPTAVPALAKALATGSCDHRASCLSTAFYCLRDFMLRCDVSNTQYALTLKLSTEPKK